MISLSPPSSRYFFLEANTAMFKADIHETDENAERVIDSINAVIKSGGVEVINE